MTITQHAVRYGQRRLTRKLYRAVPWIGGLVALATLGAAIRHKGMFRGTLDTALDFTPIVGTCKNLAEAVRGRDFIRAKEICTAAPAKDMYTAAPR